MAHADEIRRLLVQRKHENMPLLTINLALRETLDVAYCDSLANDIKTFGSEWEVRKATTFLGPSLPARPGVYMFVYIPEFFFCQAQSPKRQTKWFHPLYIGKAGDGSNGTIRSRYQVEYQKYISKDPESLWKTPISRRSELLRTYLNLEPLELWYTVVEDSAQVGRIEKGLIKLFNPPLNQQGKTKLKLAGPPIPAF